MTEDTALDPPRPSLHAVTRLHVNKNKAMVALSTEDGATLDGVRLVQAARIPNSGVVIFTVQVLCPHGVEVCGPDGEVIPVDEAFPEPKRVELAAPGARVRVVK